MGTGEGRPTLQEGDVDVEQTETRMVRKRDGRLLRRVVGESSTEGVLSYGLDPPPLEEELELVGKDGSPIDMDERRLPTMGLMEDYNQGLITSLEDGVGASIGGMCRSAGQTSLAIVSASSGKAFLTSEGSNPLGAEVGQVVAQGPRVGMGSFLAGKVNEKFRGEIGLQKFSSV